jgi:quercetin dioxygenase-like cupin family protein
MKSRENADTLPRPQTPCAAASGLTAAAVFDILSHRHELTLKRSTTKCRRTLMKIVRIYTGADHQTHFEDLAADTFATLAANVGEGPIRVNQGPAKSFSDFHNAPRRQYVVVMSGAMEIEISDGTTRHLIPGDVLVAEDLTGKGHITRGIGDDPRISLAVPLAG